MMMSLMLALSLTVEPGGLTVDGALEKIRAARTAGDNAVATVTVKGAMTAETVAGLERLADELLQA